MSNSWGMQSIYEPPEKIAVDVLFLHGLGAKWQHTWCRKDFSQPWLLDLLSRDLPEARILTWGPNFTDPANWEYGRLPDLAALLLKELSLLRKDLDRPIVFVAHSLGGLVLKEALLEAQSSSIPILNATKGIQFFGTPRFQLTEQWSDFGRVILKEAMDFDIRGDYTDFFNSDSRFTNMLNERINSELNVCCFYETLPVYRFGVLVSPEGSIIDGRESFALEANHYSMTRFDTPTDPAYQVLLGRIKMMSGIPYRISKLDESSTRQWHQVASTKSVAQTPDGRECLSDYFAQGNAPGSNNTILYALALEDQGEYSVAEKAYSEALTHFQRSREERDSLTLFCRDKYANILRYQSKYDEAAHECEEILRIKTRYPPLDRSTVLSTTKTLALVMRYQGKYKNAYDMLIDCLEEHDSILPTSFEHITIVSLLAKILKDLGYYVFSEYLSREVVHISMSLLGTDHPFTLNRLSDLSVVFSKQGKFRYAEEISRYAVDLLERQLGMDHPYTLRAAKRHANFMRFQGRVSEACIELEFILSQQQEILGYKHPAPLSTMCGLAACHILQRRTTDAKRLLEKAHGLQSSTLGRNHPETVWTSRILECLRGIKDSVNNEPQSLDEDQLERLCEKLRRPSVPSDKFRKPAMETCYAKDPTDYSPGLPKINGAALDIRHRLDARKGNISAVTAALDHGARVNSTGGYLGTLLQQAAYGGNAKLVETLLQKGADTTVQSGMFHTALKAASMQGHVAIVQILLDHDARKQIARDVSLSEHSMSISALEVAVLFGREKVVEALIKAGADANAPSPLFGSVLHQAVATNHAGTVKLLLEKGADPNKLNGLFGLPLSAAAFAGNEAMVDFFEKRKQGALSDKEVRSSDAAGHLEVFEVILNNANSSNSPINPEARTEALKQLTLPKSSPTNSWKWDQFSKDSSGVKVNEIVTTPTKETKHPTFRKFEKRVRRKWNRIRGRPSSMQAL